MDSTGLNRVHIEMADAAVRANTPLDSIVLLVVSKGRSDADVAAIASTGHRIFGENRQQGLELRMSADLPADIEWHFVGPLQSRKVRYVSDHVSLLHSMDRMSLAAKWSAASQVPVLLQFNLASEPQKSGFDPSNAEEVLQSALELGLKVKGVMAIPPAAINAEDTRPHFARLRTIFDRYSMVDDGIDVCSMGMSNDFGVAIEEGSTMVRVGRAIFEPTDH
jgi:pyridoxal phosphate enzyme (YggS family)